VRQIQIVEGAEVSPDFASVLDSGAVDFVAELAERFAGRVPQLLAAREQRQQRTDAGDTPDFLAETRAVRESAWRVAPIPADLQDRRVEITGPTDRKMIINALNSGARVFMADCEDSMAPSWDNVIRGQINLRDAVRRAIDFTSPEGKAYRLVDKPAVLIVRPRGWHLYEKHMHFQGAQIPGA
jgi:malate synthase